MKVEVLRDPGLQPERTSLAWGRTAMALVVNSLLLLRMAMHGERSVLMVVAVGVATAGVGMMWYGNRRTIQLRGQRPQVGSHRAMLFTALVVSFACATGVVAMVGGSLSAPEV